LRAAGLEIRRTDAIPIRNPGVLDAERGARQRAGLFFCGYRNIPDVSMFR
jgi:hypothetical protein